MYVVGAYTRSSLAYVVSRANLVLLWLCVVYAQETYRPSPAVLSFFVVFFCSVVASPSASGPLCFVFGLFFLSLLAAKESF